MCNLRDIIFKDFSVSVLDYRERRRMISCSILFTCYRFLIFFIFFFMFSFCFYKLVKTTSTCYLNIILYFTLFLKTINKEQ